MNGTIRDLHGRKEGKPMKYLCVDIGGSSMKYCLMSEKAEILEKGKTSLKEVSSVSDMVSVIRRQYEEYGKPEGGIAISYCGELDASTGLLYNGGSYPFMASCNLKDILQALGSFSAGSGGIKGLFDSFILAFASSSVSFILGKLC